MTEKVLKARMKINIKSTGKVLIAIVLALILVFAGYILGSKQSVLYQIKAAQEKIDGSGIFKEFQNKVSALAKIPVKLEISENEINKYINSADGADVKNIKINLSENGFMDLQCCLLYTSSSMILYSSSNRSLNSSAESSIIILIPFL